MKKGIRQFRKMFKTSGSWYEGKDEDPYSVVFVVRDRLVQDDGTTIYPTETETVECALHAFEMMLDVYEKNEDATRRLDIWTSNRIRKIVKRAHGSKWDKAAACALNGEILAREYRGGTAAVICFVPMKASEQPKAIRKLQVSGLDLDHDTGIKDMCQALHIVLEDSLEMSSGKAIAQYGHAYQLAFRYLPDDQFQSWLDNGMEVEVHRGSIEKAKIEHNCAVEVHDAGFTEIAAGSATAVAYFE